MTLASVHNSGAWIKGFPAFGNFSFVAGSADDNAQKTGSVIDRQAYDQLFRSAALLLSVTAASLGPATSTITVNVQDSADGLSFDDYGVQPADIVYAADGDHVAQINLDLAGARRYIRFRPTVNFSAGSVDSVAIAGILVAGGFEGLPVTSTPGPASA